LAIADATDYNDAFRQFINVTCPYFMPVEKLENGSWPHPSRLPLGAGWCGHCTAPDHEGEVPTQNVLEAFCNLGYAEGCSWAPLTRRCDAVRFAVRAPTEAREELREQESETTSSIISLRYVCEKNHLPVEHGELEFDLTRAGWSRPHSDPRLQKMADCYLESYLKKKL
jgi:hypothetical protein